MTVIRLHKGFRGFIKDLINPDTLIFKLIYFLYLAGVVIIWPQLTIHQQALGLTTSQTGIFSMVISGITVVMPIFAGIIGDKLGSYKIFMSVMAALGGIGTFLFTIVPSATTTTTTTTTTNGGDLFNGTTAYAINSTTHNSNNTTLIDVIIINNINNSMGVIDDRLNSSTPRMEVDPEKLVTTFWIYMAVRITFGLFQGMGYTLYEATVMVHVQKTGMDYGFQRAWGIVAVLISSLASGLLVEATGSFSLIFYLSAGLQIVSASLMLRLTLDFKLPTSSLTKEILKHLCEPEAIMLFLAMLVAGMMGGYAETYMYRYLYNLGGNTVLISLTVTLGAPFECFFMLVTSYFVSLIGHAPLIIIGLFAYVIRLLGMSFLKDPWVVLLLEIVESMANGSLNTVAILYCTVLFSMESIASCRGLLGVMNNGVGRLLGTLLGSIIREALGDRVTFRVLAAGGMVFCVLYCLAFCLLKRYRYKAFSVKTSSLPARQQASRQGATNHACNVDE